MEKKCIFILFLLLLSISMIILTGGKRTDVYLKNFKITSDEKIIKLNIGVTDSSGYVRKMKRTSKKDNGYYAFYSTFGINSKIGSKNTFEIELTDDMNEIYFYTGDKDYKLVLIKNAGTGKWQKINYSINGTLKLNLLDKEDIIKVRINTFGQTNKYYEYGNKHTIEQIYNIFEILETKTVSKTYNPENPDEIYTIRFICDDSKAIYSDKLRVDTYIEVYSKNGKYYAEQSYNGIYEITEKDFNLIKKYVK